MSVTVGEVGTIKVGLEKLGDPLFMCEKPVLSITGYKVTRKGEMEVETAESGKDFISLDAASATLSIRPNRPPHLGEVTVKIIYTTKSEGIKVYTRLITSTANCA